MSDHFRVGVGGECRSLLLELITQLAEILDNAVVYHRYLVGGVRMGIAFGGAAVGCPAGVADADVSRQGLARELGLEIAQLALGSPAPGRPAIQSGDAGGIVASVFEPLERIDQRGGDRVTAENAHNSAHASDHS